MSTTFEEFLGVEPAGEGQCRFALDSHLHGAFGGVFGGAVAAAALFAARRCVPDRRPFSLHITFVRGLSTPTSTATSTVVNTGRTLSTVAVDLLDETNRLAARATVTFAAGDALSPQDATGAVTAPRVSPHADGQPVPISSEFNPPIVHVMDPRLVGRPDGGFAHAVRIPWTPAVETAAEAVCMAADFCVGLPVGTALSQGVPIPNPDLSLRFTGHETGAVLVGVGRLARIDRGVAGTVVEVWNEDATAVLGIGLSSAVLLGGG